MQRTMSTTPAWPLILPFEAVWPVLHGPVHLAEPGSAVLGRVTMGAGATLRPHAVLRGDGHVVVVGDDFHLGEHATVHIAHDLFGTSVGHRVSVGANSIVHACTVEDDCVIQPGVAVLDGSRIGKGCVVAAGSVVFGRSELPAGHWCEGVPAVALRHVSPAELRLEHERVRQAASPAVASAAQVLGSLLPQRRAPRAYVASTVAGSGPVDMAEASSLWFGCTVQAAGPGLSLGAGCNVQDNSVIQAAVQGVHVGEGSTIGHNVLLQDCRVGARVLVGMGSTLAAGTQLQDDVLLAAGSITQQGQVLDSGWLWGGRPARALARLDDRKRDLIRRSADNYQDYALGFSTSQAQYEAGNAPSP